MDLIIGDVEAMLERDGTSESMLLAVLRRVLERFGCDVGTIHELDPRSGILRLRAQHGLPEGLLDRVRKIPRGKGMAGLAAERREPVHICNLQSDTSGVAKPRARESLMESSIAVPMLAGDDLRGTLGVARRVTQAFSTDEIALLLQIASRIATRLS